MCLLSRLGAVFGHRGAVVVKSGYCAILEVDKVAGKVYNNAIRVCLCKS